jgi:hypothetical protein
MVPDPNKQIRDPDTDPGGPKTYGSYGSGSGCGSETLEKKSIILMHQTALSVTGLFSTHVSSRGTGGFCSQELTALTSLKEFQQESFVAGFVSATLKEALR